MSHLTSNNVRAALPATYEIADKRSNAAQWRHFALVIMEYFVLIGTAMVAMISSVRGEFVPEPLFLFSFGALVIIATASHFSGQDKAWMRARAIAEKTKTLSWRYIMVARPFARENAETLFKSRIDEAVSQDTLVETRTAQDDQRAATPSMQEMRSLALIERFNLYRSARIQDQYDWYKQKAETNNARALRWYVATFCVYIVPAVLIGTGQLNGAEHWSIISIFLLVGSSLLGWSKAKRFRELYRSYTAAHTEIRKVLDEEQSATTEQDLADLVHATESAFAQEHAAWVLSKE